MSTPFLSDLEKPFDTLLEQGKWDAYLSLLSEKGLIWFLEMDLPRLVAHLIPVNSIPQEVSKPPRLAFFAEMIEPFVNESTIERYFDSFMERGDLEAAAAAVAFGLNLALEKGKSFLHFTPWRQKGDQILELKKDLSDLAQASLLAQMGLNIYMSMGDVRQAERVLFEAVQRAEAAGSDSLKLHAVAGIAYPLIFLGQFAKADMLFFDAAPLCELPHVSDLAKLAFQMLYAILRCFMGNVDQGKETLAEIASHPLFNCLPPTTWLFGQGHYMFAASLAGAGEEALAIAKRIQEVAVPEQNLYFRGYLQFNLAISSMTVGEYAKALVHISESNRLVKIHGIPNGFMSNAPVTGQVLAGLGKDQQALDHFALWHDKWIEAGYLFLAATGDLETAAILAKRGEMDQAREFFERAGSLMAEGKPTHFIRPPSFTEKLRRRLYPEKAPLTSLVDWQDAPIAIETFGGLRLHVNGKTIVDRKWRGGRTKALLKALIVLGGNKVSSDRLQDMLWPNTDGEKAAQNLKSAVYRLKRVGLQKGEKPLPWIKVQDRRVSLEPSFCKVDSILFSAALAIALKNEECLDLFHQALDLYTENFLDQDVNEAWIIRHRDSFRKKFIEGAIVFAQRSLGNGNAAEAMPFLNRALNINPLHEETYSILMGIHLKMGHPAQALQVYEQAQKRLNKELDVEPGQALTSLAQKARRKR